MVLLFTSATIVLLQSIVSKIVGDMLQESALHFVASAVLEILRDVLLLLLFVDYDCATLTA